MAVLTFLNNRSSTVGVRNSPLFKRENLKRRSRSLAQDKWTTGRLTFTGAPLRLLQRVGAGAIGARRTFRVDAFRHRTLLVYLLERLGDPIGGAYISSATARLR